MAIDYVLGWYAIWKSMDITYTLQSYSPWFVFAPVDHLNLSMKHFLYSYTMLYDIPHTFI